MFEWQTSFQRVESSLPVVRQSISILKHKLDLTCSVDAAHIHCTSGGQGITSCVQDSASGPSLSFMFFTHSIL